MTTVYSLDDQRDSDGIPKMIKLQLQTKIPIRKSMRRLASIKQPSRRRIVNSEGVRISDDTLTRTSIVPSLACVERVSEDAFGCALSQACVVRACQQCVSITDGKSRR